MVPSIEIEQIAAKLRTAVVDRDAVAFGPLLADDVRWGEVGIASTCYNRSDVLKMLTAGIESGLTFDLLEVTAGDAGVLLGLQVHGPDDPPSGTLRYQVYLVRDGLVSEIRPFETRRAATKVAGTA